MAAAVAVFVCAVFRITVETMQALYPVKALCYALTFDQVMAVCRL